jgi:hypothetical protein
VKHLTLTMTALLCLAATGAQAASTNAADNPFGGTTVSEETMSTLRGGAESTQTAFGNGVCDHCNVEGTAVVSDSAFTHAAGLFTVIQNTGINVILQNSTVVNINIH